MSRGGSRKPAARSETWWSGFRTSWFGVRAEAGPCLFLIFKRVGQEPITANLNRWFSDPSPWADPERPISALIRRLAGRDPFSLFSYFGAGGNVTDVTVTTTHVG